MPSPASLVGTVVAKRYRVESVLGQGGMGVVFGVRDEKTGVPCAIKLLSSPELRRDGARLVREARALMLISSPHVVRVFDVGELDELGPYLVLERLEGHTVAELAPLGERLPLPVVANYALQVCDALAAAHALGIVHRDVKPSNLFVTRGADGRERVKVLDFGISKLMNAAGEGLKTLTSNDGGLLGSPQFISPEQLTCPRDVDARTDLWALGVVVFRLLAGSFPFEGTTVAEIFGAILHRRAPTLAELGVDAPAGVQALLDRCLCPRAERCASASELAGALRPFADPDARTAPAAGAMGSMPASEERSTMLRVSPRRGRPVRAVALGAAAALVAISLVGSAAWRRAHAASPAANAEAASREAPPLVVAPLQEVAIADAPAPAAAHVVPLVDAARVATTPLARRVASPPMPEPARATRRAVAATRAAVVAAAPPEPTAPAPAAPSAGALRRNPYL